MTNAEVAKLAVELNLTGNFTSAIGSAQKQLGGFQGSLGKAGGALQHAQGQIRNLATVGLAALGVGIFTVTGFFEKGISKAQEFGDEVRQMAAVTGLGAVQTSALAAAMEHFNIPSEKAIRLTGFLEKNVGLLASRKDGIADFQKTFSLNLTDTNGQLLDANALILQTADYFNNKSIPATTKAAALSKLYGRTWQDMIPFLKAGRQGIADAEAEAARLGMTLTQDNVDAVARLKAATRDLGTAMGGLQLQIGLVLVPTLTELATTVTTFISEHRTDIVTFFRNALQAAKDAGRVIGDLAGTVGRFWNSIPPDVRDLLTKGLIADRTVKFLFGFSPLSTAASGIFGQFLSRGSSPANPLFVTGTGLGGPAGGISPLALVAGGLIVAAGAAIADSVYKALGGVPVGQPGHDAAGTPIAGGAVRLGMSQGEFYRNQALQATWAQATRAGDDWAQAAHELARTQDAGDKSFREMHAALVANTAALGYLPSKLRDQLGMSVSEIIKGIRERSAARYGGSGLGAAAVDATFQRDELRLAGKIAASSEDQAAKLADLKKIQDDLRSHGDRTAARKLDRLISTVQHQKPPVVQVNLKTFVNASGYVVSTTTRIGGGVTSVQRF